MISMMNRRELLMRHFQESKAMRDIRRQLIADCQKICDGFVIRMALVELLVEWEIQQIRCEKIFNPNF